MMKKLLPFMCSLAVASAMLVSVPVTADHSLVDSDIADTVDPSEKILLGDVNNDNTIDITDVTLLISHVRGVKPLPHKYILLDKAPSDDSSDVEYTWEDIIETVEHPAEYDTKTIWLMSTFYDCVHWYKPTENDPGRYFTIFETDSLMPAEYWNTRDPRLTDVAKIVPYISAVEAEYCRTGNWNPTRKLKYDEAIHVNDGTIYQSAIDEYYFWCCPEITFNHSVNKDLDEFWTFENTFDDSANRKWVEDAVNYPFAASHTTQYATWWPWMEEEVKVKDAWTETKIIGKRCIETGEEIYY